MTAPTLTIGTGEFLDDDFVGSTSSDAQDSYRVAFDVKALGPHSWVLLEQAFTSGETITLATSKPNRVTRVWRIDADPVTLALTKTLVVEIDTDASGPVSSTHSCFGVACTVVDADHVMIVVGGNAFNTDVTKTEQVGCAVVELSTGTVSAWMIPISAVAATPTQNSIGFYSVAADSLSADNSIIVLSSLQHRSTVAFSINQQYQWYYRIDTTAPMSPTSDLFTFDVLSDLQTGLFIDVVRIRPEEFLVAFPWSGSPVGAWHLAYSPFNPDSMEAGPASHQYPRLPRFDRQGSEVWVFDSEVFYSSPENNYGAIRRVQVENVLYNATAQDFTWTGAAIKPADFGPASTSYGGANYGALSVGVSAGCSVRTVGYLGTSQNASFLWFDGFDKADEGESTGVSALEVGPVPPPGLDLDRSTSGGNQWQLWAPVCHAGLGSDLGLAVMLHYKDDFPHTEHWQRIWLHPYSASLERFSLQVGGIPLWP